MKALFLVSFNISMMTIFFNNEFSTHYIVLAYKTSIISSGLVFPHEQHNEYHWMGVDEILNNDLVHFNTKAYFMDVALDF